MSPIFVANSKRCSELPRKDLRRSIPMKLKPSRPSKSQRIVGTSCVATRRRNPKVMRGLLCIACHERCSRSGITFRNGPNCGSGYKTVRVSRSQRQNHLLLAQYKGLIYAKKQPKRIRMSHMDNLCRAWTTMSVLDNGFGLLHSPSHRINGGT